MATAVRCLMKLALVHPPGEGDQHEPEWLGIRSFIIAAVRGGPANQVDSSRSDFRTKRHPLRRWIHAREWNAVVRRMPPGPASRATVTIK